MPLGLLACVIFGLASPAGADEPAPYAVRVSEENAASVLVGGPDAIGGLGDWALGNGTICAVVSDLEHESVLSPAGGVLVDLAHCGRDDDQFVVVQPVMNAAYDRVPRVVSIRAETGDGEAMLITEMRPPGLHIETRYVLDRDDPDALAMRTRIVRNGDAERTWLIADVALHGNGSLTPFAMNVLEPELSTGFAHPPVDPDSALQMARAIASSDIHVLVGSDVIEPGISYALRLVRAHRVDSDGGRVALPGVSIDGYDFSLAGVLSRPFWFGGGGVGLLELAQTLWMDLGEGEAIEIDRELRVGERADVASAVDGVWPNLPLVVGRVDDPDARLHVWRANGGAWSFVRPDDEGRIAFRAAPGVYRLELRAPGRPDRTREVEVGRAPVHDLGTLEAGPAARVRWPRMGPTRLVFQGLRGTPTPLLRPELRGFRLGSRTFAAHQAYHDVALAGAEDDPTSIALAPGRYRVTATRGPEYGLTHTDVVVAAGETETLSLAPPPRVLETPGWIASDLHVHGIASDDATLPMRQRIASLAAAGLEVAVSTEHDQIFDYEPWIRRMGLEGELASVIGSEVTSTSVDAVVPHTAGHSNAMPLPLRPLEYRDGALAGEGRRLRRIIGDLRSLGGVRMFQLNHPRSSDGRGDRGSFFSHLSVSGQPFDPTRPLTADANRSLVERDPENGLRDVDFDAVELMNGPSMRRYLQTRADWFSLLLQGERVTATANSDTHRASEVAGLPRSYVAQPDDRVAAFDEARWLRAVIEGRVYGTTGPLLDVRLGEASIGGRHSGRSGRLIVRVDAAPWVPVERLRVYRDGERIAEQPIGRGESRSLELAFERDGFVTVEVDGPRDETWDAVHPGFVPFAFSNPIWVDADGDGAWTPPGLPERLPRTLTHPTEDLADYGG